MRRLDVDSAVASRLRTMVETPREDRSFVGADLRNVDLSDAKLHFVNLSNANLDGADLSNTQFSYTVLTGASLRGANLSKSKMICVEATGADLQEVDMRYGQFEHTIFLGATFEGADLQETQFRNCTLESACLSRANLSNGAIVYSSCGDAKFNGTVFKQTETIGSSFTNADFEDAEQFLGSAEIITEVLHAALKGDIERTKLIGAISHMRHWCYKEWRDYLSVPDLQQYMSLALNVFRAYPKSGAAAALEQGLDWRRL